MDLIGKVGRPREHGDRRRSATDDPQPQAAFTPPSRESTVRDGELQSETRAGDDRDAARVGPATPPFQGVPDQARKRDAQEEQGGSSTPAPPCLGQPPDASSSSGSFPSTAAGGTAGEGALEGEVSASPAVRDQIWEVVGGAGRGGIIVRCGRDLASAKVPGRLSARALVRQVELDHGRLHYERVTGAGPERGWVSVRLAGKPLLVERRDISGAWPVPATAEGDAASDEAASGAPAVAAPSAMAPAAPGKRSLIIFDWDDTLLPLTWIEQNRLRQLQLQRTTETMEIWDQLARHAQAVVGLLRVARSLGDVVVVTLAQRPWVSESARDFLPGATDEVCGLDVFYAFEQRVGKLPVGACPFTAKKASAMRCAISLQNEDSTLEGMISIGDSDIEKQAAREVAQDCMARGKLKWSKIVKLRERPNVAQLTEQIVKLRAELPDLVAPQADSDGA